MTGDPGRERYPAVFRPARIGPVDVRNRIYMAPHGTAMEASIPGHDAHRVPSAQLAHYLAERAAGGVGLLFVSVQVGPIARQQPFVAVSAWFEEAIPSYRRIAELAHEQGAKVMAEIWYASTQPSTWEQLGPESPTFSASALQHFGSSSVRYEMRRRDIRRLIGEYGRTARHLREAGFDGIEIHVSHGVLMEHFISPYFNQRADEYGGSLENRARIVVEALEAVRAETGPDMAVGMRITADQLLPGGLGEAETGEVIGHLAATGLLDFVDIDISVEPLQKHLMTTTYFEPKLHNAQRVANLRAAAGDLVVLATPGRVTSMAEAETLLASGACDLVGAVRGLIAEPDLVRHALEGHEERSRTCIAANHCIDAGRLQGFGCALNPVVTREQRWGRNSPVTAPRAMRVLVLGAGPAGLEAARVAALRGHRVLLFERRALLGGAVALWARLPGREHLSSVARWYEGRLAELGVELRTATEADADTVLAEEPDVVIVATGARYATGGESALRPVPIAGSDHDLVHAPEDVIDGAVELSGRVVVLDEEGLNTAVGIAELAARAGARVDLVTSQATAAGALAPSHQLRYVIARLRQAGVTVHTGTQVARIGDHTITLVDLATGRERRIEVDAVVPATSRRPVAGLHAELEGRVRYTYLLGDALAPRGLREATYEGHRFARAIGTPEMPDDVVDELFRPLEPARPAANA